MDAVWLPPEVAVEQIRSGNAKGLAVTLRPPTRRLRLPDQQGERRRHATPALRRRRVLNFMAGVIARGLDLAIHRKKSISCEPDGYEGQARV